MNLKWLRINLFYFVIVACLGVLMRSTAIGAPFEFDYNHILHTHSHTAFIGWVYQSLFLAIVTLFLGDAQIFSGKYRLQFYITQALVLGMMIAFACQGYALYSIILSSLFQLMTYWFAWRFFRDWRENSALHERHFYSVRFIKIALIALVISSFGPWGLAIIVANGLGASEWYSMAIYFYLHFQYNGWFIFAFLGLFFYLLEKSGVNFSAKSATLFFRWLAVSLFPAYFLSILGITQHPVIYFLAIISGIGQVVALIFFGKVLYSHRQSLMQVFSQTWISLLIAISVAAFFLKTVLQLLSIVPPFDAYAFHNRGVIIAFIHLVVLGAISTGVIGVFAQLGWFSLSKRLEKTGITAFFSGFVATEFILIAPVFGAAFATQFQWLFGFTVLMALGVLFFWMGQLYPRN